MLCSVDTDFTLSPWNDSYWIWIYFSLSLFMLIFFSFSGGPGSRKGKLLDDVSHVYGLKLISTETVLMEELSKKLENPNSSKRTEDIAALLKVLSIIISLNCWWFCIILYVMGSKEFDILSMKLLLRNYTVICFSYSVTCSLWKCINFDLQILCM